MELKTISFKGVTRTPDNIAAPGDLAIAMNVVNDGAGLEMMEQPEVVFELTEGETFLAIHKGTGYLHYITDILSGTTHTMYYVTVSSNIVSRTAITTTNGAPSVEIIGNTIIYNDAVGIHYVLWKDGAYINLGQKPPRIDIQFGLEATLRSSGSSFIDVDVDIDDQYETSTYDLETADTIPADLNDWKPLLVDQETRVPTAGGDRAVDALIGKLTEAVMAKVNKLVADITEDNHFCNPFFVRYAYRMFDGSHIMHSYPVLVIPNTKGPICASRSKSNGGVRGDGTHLFVQMDETEALAFDAKLQYRIAPCDIQQLENWRDLITGIDIFVSAPIYPYNQAGKVSKVTNAEPQIPITSEDENLNNHISSEAAFNSYLEARITTMLRNTRTNLGTRGQWMAVAKVAPDQVSGDYAFLNDSAFDLGEYYTTPSLFYAAMLRHAKTVYDFEKGVYGTMSTPDYTDYEGRSLSEVAMAWLEENKSFEKQLRTCGTFYQLTELSFDKLLSIVPGLNGNVTSMTDVPIDEGVVSTITTRTTLEDDYLTHDIRSGGTMVNYNHRFMIADFSTTPHNPIPVFTQWARCDRVIAYVTPLRWRTRVWTSEAVDLKHTDGDSVVRSQFNNLNTNALLPAFVFYPNPDARTAEFGYTEDVTDFGENHDYVDKYITIPLKPHETLNAAVFSDGVMYNAVGLTGDTSTISASTTTRPVVHTSELIASNTDNPFSFAPSNQDKIGSGRIIALCPAVRPLSEGQFGYANLYVFTTDGVWAMQVNTKDGTFSNIAPVTRDVLSEGCKPLSLDTSVVFQAPRGIMLLTGSKAQCISEAINGDVWRVPNIGNTLTAALGSTAISNAVADILNTPTSAPALMAYDYTNQRVYVSPIGKAFSWVYNLKPGVWTQSSTHVTSAVNTYPGCVFAEDGNVVELLENNRFDRCAIITRPLCFAPLALQKIRELKGLTVDDGGTWCSVLWATRDWRRYAAIKSNMGEHPRMCRMGGSPWKAHVLGLFYTGNSDFALTHDTIMSIAGASIAYDVEQNNRMR